MTKIAKSLAATGVGALALLFGLPGCDGKTESRPDAIVLHTGRLMGNVFPEKATAATPLQHYQYLAGYVGKVRAEAAAKGIPVFLVDLGDSIDGSFASYALKGQNMVEFFNALEYDAVCLGNLDGDLSPELLGRLNAKVLCPFVDEKGEPAMPGTAATATLEKQGVTANLAANFYGLTEPREQPLRFPARYGPSKSRPVPIRNYQSIAAMFQQKNALNLLTWMKFESIDNRSLAFMKQLTDLGFDLILAHRIYGGDARDQWTPDVLYRGHPPVSINILRNNSGFTIARVDVKREGDGWKVLEHEVVPMTANSVPADQSLIRRMNKFTEPLSEADLPVTELDQRWSGDDILRLYLAALSKVPGAAAVAYSSSSIRAGWPKGPLRISQVFGSLPWRNDVVVVSIPLEDFHQLNNLSGLQVLRRDTLPNPVPLATSRFFASLIRQQPGLENVEVTSAGPQAEFEFLADFLRTNPTLTKTGNLEGWTDAAK